MSHHRKKRFRPETTVYHNSSKILPALLEDIINCYQRGYSVCKYCYYRRNKNDTIVRTKDGYFCNNCRSVCPTVWLIPASQFCENFGDFDEVPIPPTPKWSLEKKDKPFSMCSRDKHFSCFEMSGTSEVWFAHTIEELVVWTIEREYACSFQEFINLHSDRSGSKPSVRAIANKVGRKVKGYDLDELDDFESTIVLEPSPDLVFESIKDIPTDILDNVISNYEKARIVCRYCFYYDNKVYTERENRSDGFRCKQCRRRWSSVKIIPAASKYCKTFGNFRYVPIGIPATSEPEYPHQCCYKDDHYYCFEKYADSSFKYAHSVEELVVWTVEKETVGYGNFSNYIKFRQSPNETAKLNTQKVTEKYRPGKLVFSSIKEIPPSLLSSVCEGYERRLHTCRACFFDSIEDGRYNSRPTLSCKEEGSNMCEKGHYWRPIRVVPACELCESYGAYIGVPAFPRHMNKSKAPFQACNYKSHRMCFEKNRENNPWFPHSIEETVIWTVERETNRDFAQVYKQYILKKDRKTPSVKSPSPEGVVTVQEVENTVPKSQEQLLDTTTTTTTTTSTATATTTTTTHVIDEGMVPQQHQPLVSNPPLLFVDDESDNEFGTGIGGGGGGGGGDSEITFTEASLYFPALAKNGSKLVGGASSQPPVMPPYLTQQVLPPPPQLSAATNFPIPTLPPLAGTIPGFPTTVGTNVGSANHLQLPQSEATLSISDEEYEDPVYVCYLCYREFESAKALANHSTKQSHIDTMKSDFCYDQLWMFYPFPPDQVPDEFTICKRLGNCPGRVKCGCAHSLEEKNEWVLRYGHRNRSALFLINAPASVIGRANRNNNGTPISPNTAQSQYSPVRVKVAPAVQQACVNGNTVHWKLTINGQGWQTLLGVECATETAGGLFVVSAIKGDTIYTMRPKNRAWEASSFEEGILLGSIVLIIRGVSLPIGSHDCHVKLHLGLHKYLYVSLQAIVRY